MSLVDININHKIYKIRHFHTGTDFDTYIFIGGFYEKNIYKILDKISTHNYNSLTNDENKTLSEVISNFRSKFGKIEISKTHFIKDLIFEDDTIDIIRMKISNYIKEKNGKYIGINQQHLWIQNKNILYRDMISFINHLLSKNNDILLNDIIKNLQIILNLESQEDIENLVKNELFVEKYKNKKSETINLFSKESYDVIDLINNEEFIALLNNRYTILGREYKKTLKIDYNSFDYHLYIVANPFSPIVTLSDNITMGQDSNQYSKILNDYGSINNNIINLVSHTEFVSNYDGYNLSQIVSLYWDEQATEVSKSEESNINTFISDLETSSSNIYSVLHTKINSNKNVDNIFGEYSINDLIIDINDPNLLFNLNIEKIFQIFETSFDVPFVKYIISENNSNYKIYKPFVKKNLVKIKTFMSWKNNQTIQYIKYPNKKHLVFKIILKDNETQKTANIENYITLNLYENGYAIIFFNKNYYNLKEIKYKLEKINNFILKIKKINDDNLLNLIEFNQIFKAGFHTGLIKNQILNVNLKTAIVSNDLNLEDINERIQYMFPFLYGNIKNNIIKIIYKKVNQFSSDDSIQNFIYKLLEKHKKDIQKSKYLELIQSIFLIDKARANKLLDSFSLQSIPENIKYYFLYGVDITITQDKNKFNIIIENIHQLDEINKINELLLVLFDSKFDININKASTSKIVNEISNFDIEIEKDLMVKENEPVVDLGFDFNELGFEDDLGLINEIEQNIEENKEKIKEIEAKEKEGKEDKKDDDKVIIDYNLKKKEVDTHKIKFTNYMTQMREKADPGLYKVEDVEMKEGDTEGWKYTKTCDAAQMRQPYIISKENMDKIKNKKAITGYIKYRDNYYICPRIWDYKAEMPISVDEFVKNKLKSPYTQGDAIPADKRNKEFLGDKYTVIIRKPTSSSYWGKEKVEKNWPAILKNTGSEAFPGFMKPKNHPKNLCIPCCFLKEPDDYDVNAPEIQRFRKAVGSDMCDIDQDSDIKTHTQETKEFDDNVLCKNENYIKADIAILDNCRYGQLPNNLNILLRNHQEMLISTSNNSVHKYASLFLRRGIFNDKNTFLRSIACIKESISNNVVSLKNLVGNIVDNLTPELFITLNQGSLINIFKFKFSLPKNQNQLYYFSEFIKKYPSFVEMMGLRDFNIDSIEDLIKIYNSIENKDKNAEENLLKLRKIRKLFIVFSAFYNFIKYCLDDKIVKNHEFFIDLVSRPLDWLFPTGVNIMMFSKETNNIFCNPYISEINRPVIMLLYDKNGKFEPIFFIQNKSEFTPIGLIYLDNNVNISSTNLIFIKNHLKSQSVNLNLLKNTQKRLPVLKELVKIHLNNCSEFPDSKYGSYTVLATSIVVFNNLTKLSENGYPYLKPVSQITSPLNNTEFIITESGFAFPTRPSSIILDLPIYDTLEYFDLTKNNIKKLLQSLNIFDQHTNRKFGYKPAGVIVSEQNPKWGIGIILANNSLIPIEPVLVEDITKETELTIVVKNLYYEVDYNIVDSNYFKDDRIGYISEYEQFEYLYQHFKYELASLFKNNKHMNYQNQIREVIDSISADSSLMMEQLKVIIEKICKNLLNLGIKPKVKENQKENENKSQSSGLSKKKYFLANCNSLTHKKCSKHPYCKQIGKNDCGLNIETHFWIDLFINRICESIIRNINDRKEILEGTYKPSFYYNEGVKITNNELFLTNENFYLIRQLYKSSSYHQEIDTYEQIKNEDNIIKVDYKPINETSKDISYDNSESSLTESGVVELSDLSGAKKKLKNVYATVFDKDGKYRSHYQAGPCIFPYVYGNNKQLYFDCNKDKEEGQRCPVEVDKARRALKWGFCPADPRETRRKNKIEEINAKATNFKGKIDKGFKSGKCIFPFRYHPSYDLSWECVTTKQKDSQKWCATSIKTGKNIASELPIAADKNDKIYQKKWDYSSMYDSKGNFNDEFLRYSTRGYCPSDIKANVINGNKKEVEITLDNFAMNKCVQTDSKGGYSKKLLKNFAIKYLGLNPDDIEGKKKDVICKMISEKITRNKTGTNMQSKSLLDIYQKDPKMCDKGESGGGWYLSGLRKMASKYFGMDPQTAKNASKAELCGFIVPILDKELEKAEKNKPKEKIVLSSIYTKNPIHCEEGPSKGGYSLKELKEMGIKYFGISPDMNDKEKICKIMVDKLKDEQNDQKDKFSKESLIHSDIDVNLSNTDESESTRRDDYDIFNLFGKLHFFQDIKNMKKSKKKSKKNGGSRKYNKRTKKDD
jgi:hypothetical protein